MPAYLATCEGDEGIIGDVFFEKHAINARRKWAEEHTDGELSGVAVARMKGLDQYEEQGYVPMYEMLVLGWWCECCYCGVRIHKDSEALESVGLTIEDAVGTFNSDTYCCEKHQQAHIEEKRAQQALYHEIRQSLEIDLERKLGAKEIEILNDYNVSVFKGVIDAYITFKIRGSDAEPCRYEMSQEAKDGPLKYFLKPTTATKDYYINFWKERTGIHLTA